MTTRVAVGGPATGVYETTMAPRVTPEPARPFQQMMNAGSAAIVNGAEAAVTHLPGGGIIAAAMRPGVGSGQFATASALTSAVGSTGTATSGSAGGLAGVSGATAGGDPSIQQVMSQDADQNLYYLKLQEQMSAESRSYSAISNVLKARHDTMKNAIGNIR
jgi:hypothetical protein